ncbi:hypothetical protein GH714_003166 [Hevea brasiliensis]|uniref:ADF-H domain-containing protein n=1 Tax=Hevea brasiliensis TaxID=3981 RepID=A0A6A6L8N1_HEVBR|nr:hypothetical protein GH714_003166 [Hevea brasiliensis]
MAIHDECKLKFMELKAKRSYRFIVFKIEESIQKVTIEKLGQPQQNYDDFIASLPANECRYAVYDFDFTTNENVQKSKIFFIAWSPDVSKVRSKMMYASSKDRFRRELDGVQVELQATDPIVKFARATGDLQTLSDVDLKLIALTYTLEAQIHGTKHVRDAPSPIHTVNVKRLPEKDMPGWGSNVPNLEEWETLEQEAGDGSNTHSRILPLKEMSLNVIPGDDQSEDGSMVAESETHSEKPKLLNMGHFDDDAGDWMPAVSRSTHRRYLRRKARREYYEALSEKDSQQDLGKNMDNNNTNETTIPDPLLHQNPETVDAGNGISEKGEMKKDDEDLTSILEQMRLEEGSLNALQNGKEKNSTFSGIEFTDSLEAASENDVNSALKARVDIANGELDHQEILSQTSESIDVSHVDDDASEQSWTLKSLSDSSVACVTSDFAMQNVLLQMGLRLLAPGGMQIRQLHRWILKCHACYTVTAEIGRMFCPKCGNGGTLRKFSLPLPQGGRDAIAKNLILREDQLPQKFLYPKTKKKTNKEGDDFYASDNIFNHHTDKRSSFRPPVRQALAVFSGKRNPNDNHYSRPKH